jgi:glycosyltransferase involved in cell wall biosynthesis
VEQPVATVMIPTRNRRAELRRALESVFTQTVPLEVIVLDDGSTDGTGHMVEQDFPTVIYCRFDTSRGPCALRNVGSKLARTQILFPIDDDSAFVSGSTVEQTLQDFDHERIGVVAMPLLEGDERLALQHAPNNERIWITSTFIGASHAIRRDVFVGLGGYQADWLYHHEETDLSLRMLNKGFLVRLGTADPVEHRPSPVRSLDLRDRYGRRNSVLFTWNNVPTRYVPVHFARILAKGAALAVSTRRPLNHARGFLVGYQALMRQRDRRDAVSPAAYRLHRLLQRRKAVIYDEIEAMLPPLDQSICLGAAMRIPDALVRGRLVSGQGRTSRADG